MFRPFHWVIIRSQIVSRRRLYRAETCSLSNKYYTTLLVVFDFTTLYHHISCSSLTQISGSLYWCGQLRLCGGTLIYERVRNFEVQIHIGELAKKMCSCIIFY